jgi:hypothetical protein
VTIDPAVLHAAQERADEATRRGALAVILTGSHVRGSAHPESDIDLYCIGSGPDYELSRAGAFLISESWLSASACRAAFLEPRQVGSAIPGWRQAVILADPTGIAAQLQAEAHAWTWDVIGEATLDRWVAEQITGFAEEVHKLVIALERGNALVATAQRSILALRLAFVMAVNERILYDSENDVWDIVSVRLGKRWGDAQRIALSGEGQYRQEACSAALELYALAAARGDALLSREQRAVVRHALRLFAEIPLSSSEAE